jgi:4-diphosphocytidyl-2-C-methyl-D-erythritol kinase
VKPVDTVRIDCPAKVNLFLEVTSRRPDGYHDLVTVFQSIGLVDTVEVRRAAAGIGLETEGADLPEAEGNLAWDAARLFLDTFAPGAGVRMRLTKRIPIEAGLGGGSSDAAGALLALRDLLVPDLPDAELTEPALSLGSDVPFFLRGGTALGRGRGERLTALEPLPPTWLVLARPPFGLSTRAVYGAVEVPGVEDREDADALVAALPGGRPAEIAALGFNRLEASAERADPRVAGARESIGAALAPGERALLSGSGSAFFVLTDGAARAADLARALNRVGAVKAVAVRTIP